MISMEESSIEVEQERTAKANKWTDDSRTTRKQSDPKGAEVDQTHSFSKTVAEFKLPKLKESSGERVLGVNAAIVLGYLSAMCRTYGAKIVDKKWVRVKLDYIRKRYPYMGRSTVDDAIRRLASVGACQVEDKNQECKRPKFDRTRSFHVPPEWRKRAAQNPLYFDADVASKVGVPAALIYYNFMHWIKEAKKNGRPEEVQLMPAMFEIFHPFDRSTIKRAIKRLKTAGMIVSVKGKRCLFVPGSAEVTGSNPVANGSIPEKDGSNPDSNGSNPDIGGSNPDNYISYSSVVVDLENSSKEQPAAGSNEQVVSVGFRQSESAHNGAGLEQKESLSPFEAIADIEREPIFPTIDSIGDLCKQNWRNRKIYKTILEGEEGRDDLVSYVWKLTSFFLHHVGNDIVDALYEDGSDQEIFDQLVPLYPQWFKTTGMAPDSAIFDLIYFGVFEVVLDAFSYAENRKTWYHPIVWFREIACEEHSRMYGRAYDRRLEAIEREEAELHAQFLSPDHNLEWNDDLPPAMKARVFKQGLNSRNNIGWICLGGERKTDQIKIRKQGLQGVERIFELNPEATAGSLLEIMDGCMKLHATYPPVPKEFKPGCKWHARKGRNLAMFAKHLKTIIEQLGCGSGRIRRFIGDVEDWTDRTESVAENEEQDAVALAGEEVAA